MNHVSRGKKELPIGLPNAFSDTPDDIKGRTKTHLSLQGQHPVSSHVTKRAKKLLRKTWIRIYAYKKAPQDNIQTNSKSSSGTSGTAVCAQYPEHGTHSIHLANKPPPTDLLRYKLCEVARPLSPLSRGKHWIPPSPHSTAWFQHIPLSSFARTSATSKKDHQKRWYSAGLRWVVRYLSWHMTRGWTEIHLCSQICPRELLHKSQLAAVPAYLITSQPHGFCSFSGTQGYIWIMGFEQRGQHIRVCVPVIFFHLFIHRNSITNFFCKSKFTSQD